MLRLLRPIRPPGSGPEEDSDLDETLLKQAARALAEADALLIGAGAGMGVDSGL